MRKRTARTSVDENGQEVVAMWPRDYEELMTEHDKFHTAITAALGEIKRNEGSPRLGLRGIERILSHALEGGG